MGFAKHIKNTLATHADLTLLSDEDLLRLQKTMLTCYLDVQRVCDKYGFRVMLGGGSCLGAIRHQGFIPWDDDMDINMPRGDFEKFKDVFERELGEKYFLNTPDQCEISTDRFPKIFIKNTKCVRYGVKSTSTSCLIRIDIFIIENVPRNILHRTLKGLYCHALMLIASSVREERKDKGEKIKQENMLISLFGLWRRMIGFLFSYRSKRDWVRKVNEKCQYHHETGLVSIPTGRNHYFKEMQPAETFLPMSKGVFEGHEVNLPGDPHAYLSKLYGSDYMTPPPPEKREKHYIQEIDFGDY